MEKRCNEPFRSIEEISHLFLSGSLGDKPASMEKPTPQSPEPPARILPRFARPELLDEPPSTSLTRNSFFLCSSEELRPARTLISAQLGLELGRRGFRVAVVETSRQSPNLMEFLPCTGQFSADTACPGYSDDGLAGSVRNLALGFWNSEEGLGESLNMFTSLYRNADMIVVNSTPDVRGIESFVWLLNPFYVVLTTPKSSDLLNAYNSLKRISGSSPSERLGLLITNGYNSNSAEPAFRVVSGMVQKFLSRDLIFVGSLPDRVNALTTGGTLAPEQVLAESPEFSAHIVKLADTLVARSGALR